MSPIKSIQERELDLEEKKIELEGKKLDLEEKKLNAEIKKIDAETKKIEKEGDKLDAETKDIVERWPKSFWRTFLIAILTFAVAVATWVLGLNQIWINQGDLKIKQDLANRNAVSGGVYKVEIANNSPIVSTEITDSRSPEITQVKILPLRGLPNLPNLNIKLIQPSPAPTGVQVPPQTNPDSIDTFPDKLRKSPKSVQDDFSLTLTSYLKSLQTASPIDTDEMKRERLVGYSDLLRTMYTIIQDAAWKAKMLEIFENNLTYSLSNPVTSSTNMANSPKPIVNLQMLEVIRKSFNLLNKQELINLKAAVDKAKNETNLSSPSLDRLSNDIDEKIQVSF